MRIPLKYHGALAMILGVMLGAAIVGTSLYFLSFLSLENKIIRTCKNESKELCYAEEFGNIAAIHGAASAFTLLESVQQKDPSAYGCHFIAHLIGSNAFEANPGNWRDVVQTIDQRCSYGAIHGVLEAAIDTYGITLSSETLPSICGTNPRADCNHALGHLLLIESEGNIPAALKICESLTDPTQHAFCIGGVFMENITAVNLIEHGYAEESAQNLPPRIPELEALCKSHDGVARTACWEEIAHALVSKYKTDYVATYQHCGEITSEDAQARCRSHALGLTLSKNNFNLAKTSPICTVADDSFEAYCYEHLISSFLSTLPDHRDQALDYCASIPPRFQEGCLRRTLQHLGFSATAHMLEQGSI